MARGKFIVIEGTDGAGKATQVALLARHLRRSGQPVRTIAFPQYGQQSAGAVEAYLNGTYGTPAEVGTYRAAIFYAVDRAAARTKIRAWLKAGQDVVADRYIISNWAFGGALLSTAAKRKQYWKWDSNLEFGLFAIPKPDVTIILAVPPKISQQLILMKHKRQYLRGSKRDMHESDVHYQTKVLATYREIARYESGVKIVECADARQLLTKQEIHRRVIAAV